MNYFHYLLRCGLCNKILLNRLQKSLLIEINLQHQTLKIVICCLGGVSDFILRHASGANIAGGEPVLSMAWYEFENCYSHAKGYSHADIDYLRAVSVSTVHNKKWHIAKSTWHIRTL